MALTTEDVVISSWHEDLLKDGGPENYNKIASKWDEQFAATSPGLDRELAETSSVRCRIIFDSITCHGVFLQAHCGPETLPHLTRILKKEGIIVATIRWAFYESTKQDWEREIRECGCEIVEQLDVPYLGDMTAMLIVIRKL